VALELDYASHLWVWKIERLEGSRIELPLRNSFQKRQQFQKLTRSTIQNVFPILTTSNKKQTTMVQVNKYLDDGANWQAQAVLAYLRSMYSWVVNGTYNDELRFNEAEFMVGRYENCREQGYVLSLRYIGEQRNYAVYEHRNSDSLIVLVFDGITINTPYGEEVWGNMKDKYDYTKAFSCGQIVECGDYIIEDAQKFINELKEKAEKKNEGR
jgi:hypothetical protein